MLLVVSTDGLQSSQYRYHWDQSQKCDINRKMAFMIGMREEIDGHGSLKLEHQSQRCVTEKKEAM